MDHVVDHLHASFKDAADNTFLTPHIAFSQFAVSEKARKLRAGAGATRRAVVSLAGTQYEVFTIDSGQLRRCKELDVIDLVTAESGDSRVGQRLSYAQGKTHQAIEIFEHQLFGMVLDE